MTGHRYDYALSKGMKSLVAQWREHPPPKRRVVGSIPTRGTTPGLGLFRVGNNVPMTEPQMPQPDDVLGAALQAAAQDAQRAGETEFGVNHLIEALIAFDQQRAIEGVLNLAPARERNRRARAGAGSITIRELAAIEYANEHDRPRTVEVDGEHCTYLEIVGDHTIKFAKDNEVRTLNGLQLSDEVVVNWGSS